MTSPTLTLGTTVITLPAPSADAAPQRVFDERSVQRRTIGGQLRTSILSYGFAYQLAFRACPLATYDAVLDLWLSAVGTGVYPSFNWSDMYPLANGIQVAVALGPAIAWGPADTTLVNFTLTLAEVAPR
jgi:hypothetical protein